VKYKTRAAAERDLDEAASWYRESATDPRTPLRFLLEVRATFELIAESPGVFAEIHGNIRPCPVTHGEVEATWSSPLSTATRPCGPSRSAASGSVRSSRIPPPAAS
jgi:hypothetical protein